MNLKPVLRWLVVFAAIPVGWLIGFCCGYYTSIGALYLQGKGSSHNDMFIAVASGTLGSGLGGLLFPLIAWHLTKQRRK